MKSTQIKANKNKHRHFTCRHQNTSPGCEYSGVAPLQYTCPSYKSAGPLFKLLSSPIFPILPLSSSSSSPSPSLYKHIHT